MTYCVWIWCLHIHVHNTFNFLGNYGLGQNKMEQQTPSPPRPNQGWSHAKAITPHFPILDFGGKGGLNFPFILSKIVASALYNIVWYLILARKITDTFLLFLQHLQSRGAQYSNTSGQFVLNVAVWYTFLTGFLMKAENWQSTISYNNFQLIKIMQNCNIAEYQEPCIGLYTIIC